MARTAGSLNKPKFRMISLQDLINNFPANRLIPVRKDFADANFPEDELEDSTVESAPASNTTSEIDTSVTWHDAKGEDE